MRPSSKTRTVPALQVKGPKAGLCVAMPRPVPAASRCIWARRSSADAAASPRTAGLAQVADDEGDRVDGTSGRNRAVSDTVRHDTADAGLDRDDLQTVGVGGGSRQIRRVDSELDNGLAGNSVGRLGAAPRADKTAGDGRGGKGSAETALLGIADGEPGVRREEKERVVMVLQVMVRRSCPLPRRSQAARGRCNGGLMFSRSKKAPA